MQIDFTGRGLAEFIGKLFKINPSYLDICIPYVVHFIQEIYMLKSAMIRARIEPDIKAKTENIFRALGLTASDAIGIFYR